MRGAGVLGGLHLLSVGGFGGVLYLLLPRLSAPLPRPGAPGAPALPPAPAGAPGPICFVKPYRGTEESECSGVTPEQYIIKQRDWTRRLET